MGSTATDISTEEDEINVFVTGFEPFTEKNPINPSWEIAKRLPTYLPPSKPTIFSSGSTASSPTPPEPPLNKPVRIHVHPHPIHVGYSAVRALVPELWAPTPSPSPSSQPRVDYMLHIGMAASRPYYSVERLGHRDGYRLPDVDGIKLNDEERHEAEGADWIWHGCPSELESALDVEDVWRRWMVGVASAEDVRISTDPGRYLCDFIYYSSLAHLWKRGERRRVLFLHVPLYADEYSLQRGVKVALELIRAMVVSDRVKEKAGTEESA